MSHEDYVQTRSFFERIKAAPREDPVTFWLITGLMTLLAVIIALGVCSTL